MSAPDRIACACLRHPDRLGQLGMGPALAAHPLLGVGRAGARQRDQPRADPLIVGQRPSRLRPIAKPIEPLALIARALAARGLRDTPDPLGDLARGPALGGQQHDLSALPAAARPCAS